MPIFTQSAAGSYREYADRASFDVSSITVAAWICYFTASTTTSTVVRGVGNSADGEWRLGLNASGRPLFNVRYGAAAHAATAAAAPTLGVWNHYIGRYVPGDGTVFHYINNVQDGTAAAGGAITANALAIRIGEGVTTANHAHALIAHVGVWNVGLSVDERAQLYYGCPPHLVRPEALVIADSLTDLGSKNIVDQTSGSDVGNLFSVPGNIPFHRSRLQRAPGDRFKKQPIRCFVPGQPTIIRSQGIPGISNKPIFGRGW